MVVGRTASKAVKQRAKNIKQIRANRDASENALLFGNTRKGQDDWKTAIHGGKRTLSKDERMQMNRDYRQAGSGMRKDLETARQNMKNATNKEDKLRYQEEMRNIGAGMRDHRTMNPSGIREVDVGAMDRVKAAGSAVGQYYFGGSGKQMAARMGATAGAIVGVPMALDAAEGAMNSGGRPPSGY